MSKKELVLTGILILLPAALFGYCIVFGAPSWAARMVWCFSVPGALTLAAMAVKSPENELGHVGRRIALATAAACAAAFPLKVLSETKVVSGIFGATGFNVGIAEMPFALALSLILFAAPGLAVAAIAMKLISRKR